MNSMLAMPISMLSLQPKWYRVISEGEGMKGPSPSTYHDYSTSSKIAGMTQLHKYKQTHLEKNSNSHVSVLPFLQPSAYHETPARN